MSDFVGYDATQNDRDLKLGVVTPREVHRIVVVDAGENRDYCKTKESVLELILGGRESTRSTMSVASSGYRILRWPGAKHSSKARMK